MWRWALGILWGVSLALFMIVVMSWVRSFSGEHGFSFTVGEKHFDMRSGDYDLHIYHEKRGMSFRIISSWPQSQAVTWSEGPQPVTLVFWRHNQKPPGWSHLGVSGSSGTCNLYQMRDTGALVLERQINFGHHHPDWARIHRYPRDYDKALRFWSICLSYWLAAAVTGALPGAVATRWMIGKASRRQRAQLGLCSVCGYDVRATPARCPECGMDVRTGT